MSAASWVKCLHTSCFAGWLLRLLQHRMSYITLTGRRVALQGSHERLMEPLKSSIVALRRWQQLLCYSVGNQG